MRSLILGGTGLLGAHLAPKLEKLGHEVALCDNFSGSMPYRSPKEYRTFSADATQFRTLGHVFKVFKPDFVFVALSHHFAKETVYSFHEDCRLVLESANTLTAFLTKNIKHVFFVSSSDVYGSPDSRRPIKESRKIVTNANHHGAAKLSAERLLDFRCRELGIPLTIVRLFDMYGPRIMFNFRTGVISSMIDAFLQREQLGLRGAKKLRDFIHVEDAVSAIIGLIRAGTCGTINVGTGTGTSLLTVVKELSSHLEIVEKPIAVPDTALPSYSAVADISFLQSEVPSWKPRHDLSKDLAALVKFRQKETAFFHPQNAAAVLQAHRGGSF